MAAGAAGRDSREAEEGLGPRPAAEGGLERWLAAEAGRDVGTGRDADAGRCTTARAEEGRELIFSCAVAARTLLVSAASVPWATVVLMARVRASMAGMKLNPAFMELGA
jgi:hypothetical protein